MVKISLHNYLDKVDQLLEEKQFSDAAQHCLHILQQFPRHLDSYRALAKAFLGQGKHHEAIEMYQRVLSAEPNDLLAHIALSDLYRTELQASLSNWHLQRALEIEPYNEAIQAEYREVFGLDEDEDLISKRVPLNNAALGHLYLRGEMFDQATAVLQKTLVENPERIDQELLLAEALWRDGDFSMAEDICLRILEKLPNCLTANAILSDIWLHANRVSDAQPYLRRVQSLVQIDQENANYETPAGRALTAPGSLSLPDQISLKMWDETAVSVAKEEPTADWVSEISFGNVADSEESFAEPDLTSEPADMFGWLKGVTSELRGEPPLVEPGSKKQEGPQAETDWFVDKAIEDEPVDSGDHSVLDWLEGEREDLFDAAADQAIYEESEEVVPSPLPDWLENEPVRPVINNEPEETFEQENMPDWLNEVADADFEPMQLTPETASQWLIESEDDQDEEVRDDEPVDEAADWLAELSGEIDELTSAPLNPERAGLDLIESEPETAVPDKTTSDTTDWLNDLAPEEQLKSEDDWFADMTKSDDGFSSEDDKWLSELSKGEDSSEQIENKSTEASVDSPTDWLMESAPSDAEFSEDWLGALDAAPEEIIAETGDLQGESDGDDWLNDLTGEDEWIDATPNAVETDEERFDSEDLLAALAGDDASLQSDVIMPDTTIEDDPLADDWLAALAGEEFEKAADFQDQAATEEIDDDWLAELEKGASLLSSDPNEPPVSVEAGDEHEESSLTDWLSGDDIDQFADDVKDGTDKEDAVEASLTDWLSGDAIEELNDEIVQEPEKPEEFDASLTDWLSGDAIEELNDEPIQELEEVESSLTDWLSADDVEPLQEEAAEEQAEISVTDWLSEEWVHEIDNLEAAEMSSPNDKNEQEQEKKDLPEIEQDESSFDALSDDLSDWLDDLEPAADADEEKPADEETVEKMTPTNEILEPDEAELPDWLSDAGELHETAVSPDVDVPDWLQENDNLPDERSLSEFNIDSPFEGTTELPGPPTTLLDELQPASQDSEETSTPTEDVSWLTELSESDGGLGDKSTLNWLGDEQETDSLLDWMDELDGASEEDGEPAVPTPAAPEVESETAVSDEEDILPPDAIPSDLDDAMSWLEDLAAEESAPVEPLPTVADVLDEGLPDVFEVEDDQPVLEIEEADETESESDLDFLEEELFGQFTDEQPITEIEEESETEPESDLDFLDEELSGLFVDEQPIAEIEEESETEPESDLDFLEDELFGLIENDVEVESESEPVFDLEPEEEMPDLDFMVLEEPDETVPETFQQPEPKEIRRSESEPIEIVVEGDGYTEELADLDEAMAWLDNMSDADDFLDDSTSGEADALPEPVEEADIYTGVREGSELPSDDASLTIDGAVADVPEDLDDAMAWLETLAAKQGAPLEELPSLQAAEIVPETRSDDLSMEIDDANIPEIDMGGEAAGDELLETIPDVPEDLDEAMAWLEELAAKQGAPLEELPSISQSMQSDSEPLTVAEPLPEPDAKVHDEPVVDLDPDLIAALDWLDETVEDDELDEVETAVITQVTNIDLLTALDQLEQLALETEPPLVEESISEPVVAPIEAPTPLEESIAQTIEDDTLTADMFDMPDDPDEALAWLEKMSDDEPAEETAVPDTILLETEEVVAEPIPKQLDDVEDDLDSLSALDIFDMPDDPDAALAWLEEVDDGGEMPPVEEPATTMVIDPDEIEELASEPVAELDSEQVEEESPIPMDEPKDALDDLFGAFDMPDDPDAALAWLEEVDDGDDMPPAEEAAATMVIEPEEIEEPSSEPFAEQELEQVEEKAPVPVDEPVGELDDFFEGFDMPDDPDAALAWLEEVSDDDLSASVAEPMTPVFDEPETEVDASVDATEAEEPAAEDVDLDADYLSDVPEDPDEAMAWLEQLAARQGASLDELPTVSEQPEEIDAPDLIIEAGEQAETAVSEVDEFPDDEDVEEMLPSWLEADADDDVAMPGQTDWLTELPEPDVTGWLAAEAEVSGTGSEGTGLLPETGPLFESVVSDTSPLEPEPAFELEDELPLFSDTDELSSSKFQIDEEQLDAARSSLSAGEVVAALSAYRELVSRGDGLMMLINELETVATGYPEQRELRRLLGDAYMRNGQLQKALSTYREALDQL